MEALINIVSMYLTQTQGVDVSPPTQGVHSFNAHAPLYAPPGQGVYHRHTTLKTTMCDARDGTCIHGEPTPCGHLDTQSLLICAAQHSKDVRSYHSIA